MDISSDPRTVLTFDAGGTNFVFSAMQGGQQVLKPVSLPSNADHLDKCLKTIFTGFDKVLSATG